MSRLWGRGTYLVEIYANWDTLALAPLGGLGGACVRCISYPGRASCNGTCLARHRAFSRGSGLKVQGF